MELLVAFGLEGRRDETAQNSRTASNGTSRSACPGHEADAAAPGRADGGMTPGETRDATALIRRMAMARGLTLLLIEHDMSVVMGSPTASRCSTSARRSPRSARAIRTNPQVIDAYLGGVDD